MDKVKKISLAILLIPILLLILYLRFKLLWTIEDIFDKIPILSSLWRYFGVDPFESLEKIIFILVIPVGVLITIIYFIIEFICSYTYRGIKFIVSKKKDKDIF